MNRKLIKKINFIEIYQVIGGLIGVLFSIYLFVFSNSNITLSGLIPLTLIFLFFIFNIYSGILLNRKKFDIGLNLVVVSLVFQLIAFDIAGVFYAAVNGISIDMTFDLTNDVIVGFDFQFSQFLMSSASSIEKLTFKLNLLAMFLLFFTSKVIYDLKRKDSDAS
jgi:hypothetical protein